MLHSYPEFVSECNGRRRGNSWLRSGRMLHLIDGVGAGEELHSAMSGVGRSGGSFLILAALRAAVAACPEVSEDWESP